MFLSPDDAGPFPDHLPAIMPGKAVALNSPGAAQVPDWPLSLDFVQILSRLRASGRPRGPLFLLLFQSRGRGRIMRRFSQRSAFTLIELLVVIAIIAILI